MRNNFADRVGDMLVIAGVMMLVYGVWQISHILAVLIVGVMMVAIGLTIQKKRGR